MFRGFFMTKNWENILLVAGTGRNTGKTSLICTLLEKYKHLSPICVKISPHFHEPTPGLKSLYEAGNFRLYEETSRETNKDSSHYLQSGASHSYFIQATDEHLEEAFISLFPYLNMESPILIESAALYKYMQPGMFIVIYDDSKPIKPSGEISMKVADLIIKSDSKSFTPSPSNIKFNKTWSIQTTEE